MFFKRRRAIEPDDRRLPAFDVIEGSQALLSPLSASDLLPMTPEASEIHVSLRLQSVEEERGAGPAPDPRRLDEVEKRRELLERERANVRPVIDFGMPTTGSEWIGGGEW
jgi:hypothetical protein